MFKIGNQQQIIRLGDGAVIPPDLANIDYRAYQTWLAAGNTPEPADTPSLAEVKAEAEATINQIVEQAKIKAGIVIALPGMVAQYASNAFYVERWIAAGRPGSPAAADYPTAEAERQGFTPVKSLAQMLATWETMWVQMNAANAGMMLVRRQALEAVKKAESTAEAEAAVATLRAELGE